MTTRSSLFISSTWWCPVRVPRPSRAFCRSPQPLELSFRLPAQPCARTETGWFPRLNNAAFLGNQLPDASIALPMNVSMFGPCATLSRASRGVTSVLSRKKSLALTSTRLRKIWHLSNPVQVLFESTKLSRQEAEIHFPCFSDCDDTPIFDPDDAARRLCQPWKGIFRARDDGILQEQADAMLSFIVPAPRNMVWTVEFSTFEEMLGDVGMLWRASWRASAGRQAAASSRR